MNARSRRLAAVAIAALIAALLTAGTASPARAPHVKGTQALVSCINASTPQLNRFSAISRVTYGISARGERVEPDLGQLPGDLPASAKGKAGKSFSATVPVFFHVITDGSLGNVSSKVISDQLQVLNMSFAGFYGGAKSGFKFTLAGVDRTNNADWYNASSSSNAARDMKRARCTPAARTRSTSTRRRPAAPPARTRARRIRASTRSTTSWTTRTTPATRSSRPARSSACATPGCCTGRRSRFRAGRVFPARPIHSGLPAPVAQGIERAPPEREVAGSIPAWRTSL